MSQQAGGRSWTSILALLDSGERLFGLALLAGLSLISIAAASGAPGGLIAGGALLAGLLLVGAVVAELFARARRLERTAQAVSKTSAEAVAATSEVDTFFAAPMAAAADYDTADDVGPKLLMILEALREKAGAKEIYYGGKLISKAKRFDDEPDGYRISMSALEKASRFVLIWPRSLPSSALFELGVAKARRLPTAVFYKDEKDLPYLLRGRAKLPADDRWPVRFYEFQTINQIIDTIALRREKLFEPPADAAA